MQLFPCVFFNGVGDILKGQGNNWHIFQLIRISNTKNKFILQ